MLLTSCEHWFSPNAVYIVSIKKDDEHIPSVGFFHHRKHATGFLTYAKFSSEIRTVKVGRSEPSLGSYISHTSQCYFNRDEEAFLCL